MAILEGDFATLTGTFTDADTIDTHKAVIDWGDGTTDTLDIAAGATVFSAQHRYLDNLPADAPYTISASLTDHDGPGQRSPAPMTERRNVDPAPWRSQRPPS